MVGHSTGGGEVARYLGRHGTKRVAKAVLISAVPPLMLKTEKNPGGLPISVFDGLRAALAANRPQFYKDITLPFYGYNRPGAKISEGIREHWWLQGMMGGVKAHYDCIKAFSETDFTEDLKKIDIPVLVMHGDDDQIVPIGAAGLMSAKILKNATLKVYPGFPHGMPATNADQINADLLALGVKTRQSSGGPKCQGGGEGECREGGAFRPPRFPPGGSDRLIVKGGGTTRRGRGGAARGRGRGGGALAGRRVGCSHSGEVANGIGGSGPGGGGGVWRGKREPEKMRSRKQPPLGILYGSLGRRRLRAEARGKAGR